MEDHTRRAGGTRTVSPGELLAELEQGARPVPRRRGKRRMSRNRYGLLGAATTAALLLGALVIPALAVHDDGFQLEGNVDAADLSYVDIDPGGGGGTLTPGTLSGDYAGPYDWYDSDLSDGNQGIFDATGASVDQTANGFVDSAFVPDFVAGGRDDLTTFTGGGSKDDHEISDWKCVQANNVTDKGDIINAYATIYEQGGKRILYFGIEKYAGNGDNNVGLWLLQGGISCDPPASGSGNNFVGAHTDHDLFLVAENTNGGGIANITAYEWIGGVLTSTGVSSADCLDNPLADDRLCATTNGEEIDVPWPHQTSNSKTDNYYDKVAFIEGGIELSAFPDFAETCYTGFLFNTRSSQELGAELYDYARGAIDTCAPDLSLTKTPDSGTYFVGDSFDWNIVVDNTGDGNATDAVVTDTIASGLSINSATVQAPGTGSCSVNGQDVECTVDVPAGESVTIKVNVTIESGAVTDEDGCNLVDNSATVTGDEDTSDNTDTGQVEACVLSVTKTATTTYDRTYDWTIEKSVDPETKALFDGQTADFDYSVTATKGAGVDSNAHVAGNITVHNPASIGATLTSVTDSISGVGSAPVVCPNLTVPAGGDLVCSYSSALPNTSGRTNTATATQDNGTEYQGTANVTFGAPTNVYNDSDSVDDTIDDGDFGPFSSTTTNPYTETYDCSGVEYTDGVGQKKIHNTATLVNDGDSASADVTITCYRLSVTKSADTSYDRDYDWTIDKSADATSLTLAEGQSYIVNYSVKVTRDGGHDSNYAVSGDVVVHNPAPMDATLTSISDTITGIGAVTLDCPNMTVPASGTLTCTYETTLPDKSDRTNTATATAYTKDYTGDADITFGSPTNTTDECVDLSDTFAGDLGTVCAGGSTTKTYTRDVGQAACGEYDLPNTASFETNDNGDTGSDGWTVHVSIPCPTGCTLTQGYWKTHSSKGPAPYDDAWGLLDALEGSGTPLTWAGDGSYHGANEPFFYPTNDSATWYKVFWTSPSGNAYYQLAHQYEAAVLNILNDADAPASVTNAIAHAEALFEQYSPADIAALKGNDPLRKDFIDTAGILGSYNTGKIGPGHCDEDGSSSSAP
jgi:uncharacterized repeat protein (TIGR01451 family)